MHTQCTMSLLMLLLSGGGVLVSGASARADIRPDNTAGSRVRQPNAQTYEIFGGRQYNQNLIHSFQEFSIPRQRTADFLLPPGSGIKNVITRVTGGAGSNIDGTLKIGGQHGPVNLFLLNPSGIIFGPNASLDLQGSFIATTAERMTFSQGFELSAVDATPLPTLLSIGVPIGVQFGDRPAPIVGQFTNPGRFPTPPPPPPSSGQSPSPGPSLGQFPPPAPPAPSSGQPANSGQPPPPPMFVLPSGLRVNGGQTLALLGGDLNLRGTGEIDRGSFIPATFGVSGGDGQIVLGAAGSGARVGLTAPTSSQSWSVDFSEVQQFGDITVQDDLVIIDGGTSDISFFGRDIRLMDGVQIGELATGVAVPGRGGQITFQATNLVSLSGGSLISPLPTTQKGSSLSIQAPQFQMSNSIISTTSQGVAMAGNITIEADEIQLEGSSILASARQQGTAGEIRLEAQSISLDNFSKIEATANFGRGGNIFLTADDALVLRRNSNISTSSRREGDGGNIDIEAGVIAAIPAEDSNISTDAFQGNGGNIRIRTQGLFGIAERSINQPDTSDITANSSQDGVSGSIDTNILTSNPLQQETESQPQLNDIPLALACVNDRRAETSRFTNSGKGGIPANPTDLLGGTSVWQDMRSLPPTPAQTSRQRSRDLEASPLVEAQGWFFAADGTVRLVADAAAGAIPPAAIACIEPDPLPAKT